MILKINNDLVKKLTITIIFLKRVLFIENITCNKIYIMNYKLI